MRLEEQASTKSLPSGRRAKIGRTVGVMFVSVLTVIGVAGPASAITQASAASQLSAAGITWSSSGNCTDRYNSTCTSFEGIRQGTVDYIINWHSQSNCAVNITGGTEIGHATGTYSHWNGYKLDITHRTCTDNYVVAHYTRTSDCPGGYPRYVTSTGNQWCDEGTHWDITVY